MPKTKQEQEQKPYTATDAALDVVEFAVEVAVVAPVSWLLSNTVGWVLDAG